MAAEGYAKIRERGTPSGQSHSKDDFGDKAKWTMGDLDIFVKLVKSLEDEIIDLYAFKDMVIPSMREIESNLLKGMLVCSPFRRHVSRMSQLKLARKRS